MEERNLKEEERGDVKSRRHGLSRSRSPEARRSRKYNKEQKRKKSHRKHRSRSSERRDRHRRDRHVRSRSRSLDYRRGRLRSRSPEIFIPENLRKGYFPSKSEKNDDSDLDKREYDIQEDEDYMAMTWVSDKDKERQQLRPTKRSTANTLATVPCQSTAPLNPSLAGGEYTVQYAQWYPPQQLGYAQTYQYDPALARFYGLKSANI